MKTKLIVILMLSSLIAGIMVTAVSIRPVAAAGTIAITPSPINKTPTELNSFFDVFVEVSTTDLFGFDIKITWDNSLIIFSALDNTLLSTVWPQGYFEPLNANPPHYQTGVGYVRYAAVATGGQGHTGTVNLFKLTFQIVKACNFEWSTAIHFDTVKLSDSNYTPIIVTATDGQYHMSATVPDVTFVLVNPNPSKPFEYCKTFEVEVYASHICAQMTDYDLTILYTAELLKFVDVDYWGTAFGSGHIDNSIAGSVRVWIDPVASPLTGDSILLFALTFHVEFNDDINHIWRVNAAHTLPAQISVRNDVGEFSYVEGHIPITGITLPTPLALTIILIRGDVDCNGKVDVFDLRCVAAYYDQATPVKYDLTMDGMIDIFDLVVVATNFGYNGP